MNNRLPLAVGDKIFKKKEKKSTRLEEPNLNNRR
jgi:hypothetical protein